MDEPTAALATAARRVVDAVVRAGGAVGDRSADLAETLHAVADELDKLAPPLADRMAAMWQPLDSRPHNMVTGWENPLAPPVAIDRAEDGSVTGSMALGLPYQGPPGHLHGGMSALVMDHVLGLANIWAGNSGMTARLTLTFHRPLPLFTELAVTGRQVAVDGRKIHSTGAIGTDDGPGVTAEGLFITPRSSR
ncbi:PaaI family thioesterase [Actinokineospora sp. NBRC 105648]|uniref:PaaI family thioesterase n=1 Tax=Actinokineospora sp. NBRC 105648 TaxID=3032206 RepID=UPI0024A469FF|nr:PaaI family thioesterase [Actinokineospora sp. NBRC 105648]GLZ41993.1 aromatic compound degradation protein PaaI [Actinokineospora sp. NBRC 105648]